MIKFQSFFRISRTGEAVQGLSSNLYIKICLIADTSLAFQAFTWPEKTDCPLLFRDTSSCCSWSGSSDGSYDSELEHWAWNHEACRFSLQLYDAVCCTDQTKWRTLLVRKNSQHLHCVLYFKFLVYCTVMHPVRCTMCSILRKGGNRGSKGLHWFSIYCFSSCISVFCISHPEMRCARACKILDSWGSGFGTPFVSADPSESMPPPESLIL